jgi:hypothetical protein|nr:MAG TPA: hypothetical protein [Bacteriophage sp.]
MKTTPQTLRSIAALIPLLQPTTPATTYNPQPGGHTTPGSKPPCNLHHLHTTHTTLDELADILHTIYQSSNNTHTHTPRWQIHAHLPHHCHYLANHIALVAATKEPQQTHADIRVVEQELTNLVDPTHRPADLTKITPPMLN